MSEMDSSCSDNLQGLQVNSNCEYLKRILYLPSNSLTKAINWSMNGRHLKICYPQFNEEYLSKRPMKCDSKRSFIEMMEYCGFVRICDIYRTNSNILSFQKVDFMDDYHLAWNNTSFEEGNHFVDRNISKVNCTSHRTISSLT